MQKKIYKKKSFELKMYIKSFSGWLSSFVHLYTCKRKFTKQKSFELKMHIKLFSGWLSSFVDLDMYIKVQTDPMYTQLVLSSSPWYVGHVISSTGIPAVLCQSLHDIKIFLFCVNMQYRVFCPGRIYFCNFYFSKPKMKQHI